jgi:UDP-N-acetylglucosamine--N-acetylmuramyl-(pentapeptide) pyrophosphoryl-undecaprenol N-acetylglucosamine transferase
MQANKLFLMAGGGTGGHVIPALAVAGELRQHGHSAIFIGTERGVEARLVPKAGFPLELIRIGGIMNLGPMQKVTSLLQLFSSTFQQWKKLAARRPAAVFSMGGYVAGPPVLAALLRRVPVVVMEPNAVPGITNRWIGRYVNRALLSFPETARYFAQGKTEVTGLPVRDEFFPDRTEAGVGRFYGSDYRWKSGLPHAEQCGACQLAALPRLRAAGAIHPSDGASYLRTDSD